MSKTAKRDFPQEAPQSDEECQAAIHAMFEEMDEIDARIDQHRVEIDRLKAETRVILDDIKCLTDDLGQNRGKTDQDQERQLLLRENQRLRSELGLAPEARVF